MPHLPQGATKTRTCRAMIQACATPYTSSTSGDEEDAHMPRNSPAPSRHNTSCRPDPVRQLWRRRRSAAVSLRSSTPNRAPPPEPPPKSSPSKSWEPPLKSCCESVAPGDSSCCAAPPPSPLPRLRHHLDPISCPGQAHCTNYCETPAADQNADFWQGLINRALQRMLHSIFISSPFHKCRWYSRSPGT